MKLSILCIANKKKIYDEFLENLSDQNFRDFELITIMNTNGEYSGACRAFNDNAGNAKGEYLMFIHPDIRFTDENALEDIVNNLEREKPFGVLGVAGAAPCGKNGRVILTSIVQGENREPVGEIITSPVEVQTLDECLFVIEKDYFKDHSFPDREGWHLYCAEYCLDAIRDGRVNKAVPSKVWHLSAGSSLDENYMDQLEALIEKEKDSFDLICTTVKPWKTSGTFAKAYRKYYYFKQLIKRKIRK